MAEFSMVSETVFPTANDVSTTLNKGRRWSEETVRDWTTKFAVDFVSTGFTVPSSDADLVIPVSSGIALLNGYLIEETVSTDVTAIDNSTSFLFLRLKKVSALVTEAVFAVEASPVPVGPEDLLLATLVASGGVITATTDNAVRSPNGFNPTEALTFIEFGV